MDSFVISREIVIVLHFSNDREYLSNSVTIIVIKTVSSSFQTLWWLCKISPRKYENTSQSVDTEFVSALF